MMSNSRSFCSQTNMSITPIRSLRNVTPLKEVLRMVGHRTYAAGAAKKKGSKGGAAAAVPKASLLTKEVKSTTVFGANILMQSKAYERHESIEY
ncbi:Mitochondrial ribosomal protein L37 [Striga hermonthica]|uniref:Mitochondrial ribosomal protein L37 n=1 Tax=Striga hermonthica TaxID=68872 RepID=A0A9N7MJ18_STRHE|nr:Mitochondrial ribosomal protein L37 [Striga hermonthica]